MSRLSDEIVGRVRAALEPARDAELSGLSKREAMKAIERARRAT